LIFLLMPNSGRFSGLIMFLPVYVFVDSALLTDLDHGGQPQGEWSNEVLEYWSVGAVIIAVLHYSNTPIWVVVDSLRSGG
jgi:hypothetical protein